MKYDDILERRKGSEGFRAIPWALPGDYPRVVLVRFDEYPMAAKDRGHGLLSIFNLE